MPKEAKPPTKADQEAAERALAARVAIGKARAVAFAAATQGTEKSGKPGCKPKYPLAKA